MKRKHLLATMAVAALGITQGSAQVLFNENFDSDHTANWNPKLSHADASADFFFDYSTIGIPSAPNSGGTTRGARFLANQSAGIQQGISATPIGQSFTGNYRVSMDMWLNYVGPLTAGGNGSTQVGSFGIGTSGTTAQWAGASSSIMFGATGDGGSTFDYRVYTNNTLVVPATGVYAAGTTLTPDVRNNTDPYYTSKFGGASAPAAQLSAYPNQTETTGAGALGFAWRNVVIEKRGAVVTWKVDNHLMATVSTNGLNLSTNIFIGAFDINAGSSTDPQDQLIAAIYDNVRVEAINDGVDVSATTSSVTEGGTTSFTFNRGGDISGPLTVFFTVSGTATSGADFTALPSSVTFLAGQGSTTLNLATLEESIAEATETVILTLNVDPSYQIGNNTASISIIDNEPATIAISALQSQLLEGYASSRANFRVTRLGTLSGPLTVNIAYSGTATRNTDFNGNTTVSLTNNATAANVSVTPIADITYEGNESIIASIATGTGYGIDAASSATVTLVDDEYQTGSVLFSDNFDDAATSGSTWAVNVVDSDATATFAWDYAANAGIPAAPHSIGGNTLGVRFTANDTVGGVTGISISPTNYTFSGDYRLSFDMWVNYNGPLNTGGTGSTEAFNAGIGTSGLQVNYPNGAADGGWFSVMGDGGNSNVNGDYNAYYNFNLISETTGVYAAGTAASAREHLNPFYSIWGGNGAPAAQIVLAPAQTNNTPVGVIGMAWHTVSITKKDETVTWIIDGVTIASITNDVNTTPFSTTGTIFIGYHDPYNSLADNAAMSFAVADNLRVETLASAPPTPPVLGYSRSGNSITLTWTGAFTLQEASVLSGSPSDWSNVSGVTGTSHTVNTSSGIKFYRLRN